MVLTSKPSAKKQTPMKAVLSALFEDCMSFFGIYQVRPDRLETMTLALVLHRQVRKWIGELWWLLHCMSYDCLSYFCILFNTILFISIKWVPPHTSRRGVVWAASSWPRLTRGLFESSISASSFIVVIDFLRTLWTIFSEGLLLSTIAKFLDSSSKAISNARSFPSCPFAAAFATLTPI